MNSLCRNSVRPVTTILALACAFSAMAAPDGFSSDPLTTPDASGWLRTFTPAGTIDTGNPFFQSLGTNGRSCNSCHRQAQGWTVTPAELQQRFAVTQGLDPIFRTNDGSVSPFADVSTLAARRKAYALLLNRGLIRVGLPIPANAEFSLTAVDDPYHYASAAELSLFRRPLPATNLGFLTTVMWDGRETAAPFKPPMDAGVDSADLDASLASQAKDAVLGHAQGTAAPSDAVLAQIVAFESGLSTAQIRDDNAGLLNDDDAIGGPRVLANLRFYVGINDALGADPTGAAFDPSAMHLFDAWATQHGNGRTGRARAAIQRGEALFNTFPITITGVAGLNDVTGQPSIQGHCSTCHDTPNVGNHSVAAPLDIGLADASRRTPDMPLYTLTNNQTGASVQTTDPGRALLTGKWADIGKFKGATLRGLAARAPYFHNGSAATLMDAVDFYNTRFSLNLGAQQKQDLVAFLAAL
jgi:cytochrome c peroxidase